MSAKKSVRKAKAAKAKSAAAKRTAIKKIAVKGVAPRKSTVSIAGKSAISRAAEVERNIGGSRPLSEFLDEINWYK